ncbi:peptide chain release factor N(5)-glutamine methyltransferase [Spongiimicrobium sp. 2-473A-2-J]|uniref:peptide chain release factor N(5)-glutamine methyltransferase n=1 Tax=Eudoraea algarum TaxID=3417568 RepID=UPI003D36FC7C
MFRKDLNTLYPTPEIDGFFYMLMEEYLGLERFVLALEPKLTLSKAEEQLFFEALGQLRLGRPIQYILGKAHFMDAQFAVNQDVLIPRSETEELVAWILSDCRSAHKEDFSILDVGTGSGCIAISLASALPKAEVTALDVSAKALAIAMENAHANGVQMQFVQQDILKEDSLEKKFDIIVSNPPYVRELEKSGMHKNVKDFEPDLALFVSDERPLVFYERITDMAKTNLKQGGTLYFEVNQYLGKETQRLLQDQNFLEIELRKDLSGKDRMLKGKLPLDMI